MPTSALPRYVGYVTLPGWCRAELYEYDTLHKAARDLVERARCASYYGDPHLDLYFVDGQQEMVDSAREFEGVGIPFDYPDYRISLGPCGGARIERA